MDTKVSANVENAFHALSLDEHRKPFSPAVWEKPLGQKFPTTLRQCWFSGVHSNVGGGYADTETADITLAWMMSQFDGLLDFDSDYITWQHELNVKYYQSQKPPAVRPWGMGELYNSFTGLETLAGSRTRTPGQYHATDPITGKPLPRFLHDTNEQVHPSVRVRLECHGKGAGDRGVYDPPALKNFKLLAPGELAKDQYEDHFRWVFRAADGREVVLPESFLGDVELKLLGLSPEQKKMVDLGA